MNRFVDKVVLITGAGGGQGRRHATAFAAEGAHVVGFDLAPLDDLAAELAESGVSAVLQQGDVRDSSALRRTVEQALAEFGRLDVVVATAGVVIGVAPTWELTEDAWQETMDINVRGSWLAAKHGIPAIIAGGRGGSVIFTGSTAGVRGEVNIAHYVASKHALQGLARTLAREAGPHGIRVNVINPTTVDTPMVNSENFFRWLRPDLSDPTRDDVVATLARGHALPVGWLQPEDVTNAVLWLASDEARYVTGHGLLLDAGATLG